MKAKEMFRLARQVRNGWSWTSGRCIHSATFTTPSPQSQNPFPPQQWTNGNFRYVDGHSSIAGSIFQQQIRGMFIQTQPTPNPASLMFLPGRQVMTSGVKEFMTTREAMASPLAKKLFSIEGVKSVFFGSDFITVTKAEDATWAVLKPDVFAGITDHFASGEPLLAENGHQDPATTILPDDNEIVASIKELLETRIRPVVQDDGGDVLYQNFDEKTGVVSLKMVGACSGCPSSSATLKGGIENMLKHYVPEVTEVVQVMDEQQEVGLNEFNKLESQLST